MKGTKMKKIILLLLFSLKAYSQAQENLVKTSFDKRCLFGAAALGIVAIPFYWYFNPKARAAREINALVADHQKRMKDLIRNNIEFEKFVIKYSPPCDLFRQLVVDEKKIYRNRTGYNEKSKEVFIEGYDVMSMINAERMRNYIKQKGFETVAVPRKYIFLVGDQWAVITERVNSKEFDKWRVVEQQIKELVDVVENLGYSHFDKPDLIIDTNDKFVFTNTANSVFKRDLCFKHIDALWNYIFYTYNELNKYARSAYNVRTLNPLTVEARTWLYNKIDTLKSQNKMCNTVVDRADLDDPNIDMSAVKNRVQELKKTQENQPFNYDYFTERAREEARERAKEKKTWFGRAKNYVFRIIRIMGYA